MVTSAGTTRNITGGTRPGGGANLFHSFGTFNVSSTDTANFCNATACGAAVVLIGIQNILGRVTDGQVSNIFGKIQTTNFGTASLYLINPAGWILGPTASLNVGGAFRVATADSVLLTDGIRFNAIPGGSDALLSSAPVAAFGFLSANPAGITVQQGGKLIVGTSQTLSLVGGQIQIVGTGGAGTTTLGAAGGRVEIASVASPGDVSLRDALGNPQLRTDSFSSLGQISLSNAAQINVNGTAAVGGGSVVIRGGQLIASGASTKIFANTTSAANGAATAVDMQVSGSAVFNGAGAGIEVRSSGAGAAGDVLITAGSLEVSGAASFNSITSRGGAGGDIAANVGTLTINTGGGISSLSDRGGFPITNGGVGGDVTVTAANSVNIDGANSTISTSTKSQLAAPASGRGGQISISTPTLTVDHQGSITTSSSGTHAGGDLSLQVGNLALSNGGQLNSSTATATGGLVNVTATGSVSLSGAEGGKSSGIISGSTGNGAVGALMVEAGQVNVADGGKIQAGNNALPGGGDVTVHARDSIVLTNRGEISSQAQSRDVGKVDISAPTVLIDNGLISTSTTGTGHAGNVSVNTINLTLTNGGQITSSSTQLAFGAGGDITINAADSVAISGSLNAASGLFSTASGRGAGGRIQVSAPTLTMSNGGEISAATTSNISTGVAGSVQLDTGALTLGTGARVDSGTTGSAQGGSIAITATDSIAVSGTGSGLLSTASSAGNAGQIAVTTPTLAMTDGGIISVATSGSGNAGNISLNVTNFTQTGGARVDSSTSAAGHGGNLTVAAANSATISDPGSGLSSTASGTGAGGNIGLQAENIQLLNGGTITTNSTGSATATAGNVNLVFGDTLRMLDSSITTAATVADGGNISITATGSMLQMTNSNIITSVASGFGTGGNITIGSPSHPLDFVVLNNSQIRADAFGGPGGNININADVYLTSNSVVSASSQLSSPGIIDIEATFTDVSGSVAQLPETPLKATDLLRASCAARFAGGNMSSLVLSGRDGLPIQPGGVLPSPLYLASNAAAPTAGVGSLTQGSTAGFNLLSAAASKDRLLTQYSLLPTAKCAF